MVHLILMNVKLVGIMSARCKAETSGIKLKQKNKNDAFQHFDHHHLLVFMNDDDTLGIYQRLTKLWKTSIYEMSG